MRLFDSLEKNFIDAKYSETCLQGTLCITETCHKGKHSWSRNPTISQRKNSLLRVSLELKINFKKRFQPYFLSESRVRGFFFKSINQISQKIHRIQFGPENKC